MKTSRWSYRLAAMGLGLGLFANCTAAVSGDSGKAKERMKVKVPVPGLVVPEPATPCPEDAAAGPAETPGKKAPTGVIIVPAQDSLPIPQGIDLTDDPRASIQDEARVRAYLLQYLNARPDLQQPAWNVDRMMRELKDFTRAHPSFGQALNAVVATPRGKASIRPRIRWSILDWPGDFLDWTIRKLRGACKPHSVVRCPCSYGCTAHDIMNCPTCSAPCAKHSAVQCPHCY